jgi:outer membrane protein assembly factor BamB
MRLPFARAVVLSTFFSLGFSTLLADDWVRFRGSDGGGISSETVPTTWSATENLRWKTPLPGPGTSSPIVVGERVFVTCFIGYSGSGGSPSKLERSLLCLNRKTGAIQWEQKVKAILPEDPAEGFINDHGYASSTPTSDGERVYVFYGKSGVLAYDLTGKKLWETSVGTGTSQPRWGSGASPILFEDLVIVNAAIESRTIYGLDKLTGEIKWKSPADTLHLTYSTPILVKTPERTEMIVSVPGEVWGMNPKTGKMYWYAKTNVEGNASPSAIAHDGVVYLTGGRPAGTTAVKVGGRGDVTKTNVLWSVRNGSYVPTPVYHDGKLYWVSDQGLACAVDAKTGESIYKERMGSGSGGLRGRPFYASVSLIGDKLYAVSRNSGTFVYEPGDTFKVLHTNKLGEDVSDCNASPAVSNGELFLRSNEAIYCIGK